MSTCGKLHQITQVFIQEVFLSKASDTTYTDSSIYPFFVICVLSSSRLQTTKNSNFD